PSLTRLEKGLIYPMAELMMTRRLVASSLALAVLSSPIRTRAAGEAYQVDPSASRVTIAVGKGGAFSFIAGHTHEVVGPIQSGMVDFDRDDPSRSRVRIAIATSALKVSAAGEPPNDVPK